MYDLLNTNIWVTFSVDMANASQYPSGPAFTPGTDLVFVNSPNFNGAWISWDPFSLQDYQLYQVGSSTIYTNTFSFPAGAAVSTTYKYGINGLDNEAGSNNNHDRLIRSEVTGAYSFPTDTFGSQYVEPAFGGLQAVPSQISVDYPSKSVKVSWLGSPSVQLQTTTNLTKGPWITHPETSGATWKTWAYPASTNGLISVTNMLIGNGPLYFRLQQQ